MRLCTQGFSKKENEILRNMLYIKFNVKSKVMEYKYKNKLYYHITILELSRREATSIS